MDATLREPDARRDADLVAVVAQLREEISQLRRNDSDSNPNTHTRRTG